MFHAVLRLFGNFSLRYLLWPTATFVHSVKSQQEDFTKESQTTYIENQMFAKFIDLRRKLVRRRKPVSFKSITLFFKKKFLAIPYYRWY